MIYTPDGIADQEITGINQYEVVLGQWRVDREHFLPLQRPVGNRGSRNAKEIQTEFMEYFNSPNGAVPWHWRAIF